MDAWLNGIGLTCGLVAALLMYRYGVPRYPHWSLAGRSVLLLEQDDHAELAAVYRAERLSRAGVVLLAVGFLLQLIALAI